uniref:Secreted protein n=1 Tax=Caenorhabditis tropicalis TaxID=1561998 RepID=A0A1I7TWY0_9PELO
MNTRLVYAIAVLAVFASAQSDDDWDATVRDQTEFCGTMAQYAPNGGIYCTQFLTCCDRQFDPNNGDKCQVKESECNETDDGRSGVGICKFSNCTELITTTTTTTTPAPQYESINAAYQAVTILAPLAAALFCVL